MPVLQRCLAFCMPVACGPNAQEVGPRALAVVVDIIDIVVRHEVGDSVRHERSANTCWTPPPPPPDPCQAAAGDVIDLASDDDGKDGDNEVDDDEAEEEEE